MALYPIRLLKDKNRHPFFPFNTLESVLVDGTNKNLADLLDEIYTKDEVNTMFTTELSKFSVYSNVSELPATARDGAVAAIDDDETYIMYMFYDNSWHALTQKGDKGDPGSQGPAGPYFTPSVNAAGDISWTNNGGLTNPETKNIKGPQGLPGADGQDGVDGADGEDGVSPIATVTKEGGVATITITDANGTTTTTISDGQDGQDGYSPTATVSKSGKVATISITDKNGTTTATVSDGEDGSGGSSAAELIDITNEIKYCYENNSPCDISSSTLLSKLNEIQQAFDNNSLNLSDYMFYFEAINNSTTGYPYRRSVYFIIDSINDKVSNGSRSGKFAINCHFLGKDDVSSKLVRDDISLIYYSASSWDMEYKRTFIQDLLVSGTNIKTINNNSILGSGNIDIESGGSGLETLTSPVDVGTLNDGLYRLPAGSMLQYYYTPWQEYLDILAGPTDTDAILGVTNVTENNEDIVYIWFLQGGPIYLDEQDNPSSGEPSFTYFSYNKTLNGPNNVQFFDFTYISSTVNKALPKSDVVDNLTSNAYDKALSAKQGRYLNNNKQDKIDSTHKLSSDLVDDTNKTNKFVTASEKTTWSGKQDALVSGTNVKTINNESILGSGNISISGGSGIPELTSPAYLYALNDGYYRLPEGCLLYDSEHEDELLFTTTTSALLSVSKNTFGDYPTATYWIIEDANVWSDNPNDEPAFDGGGIKLHSGAVDWYDDGTISSVYDAGTKFLTSLVTNTEVLTKTNTTFYQPSANYHPATKLYVDTRTSLAGIPKILDDTNFEDLVDGCYMVYDPFGGGIDLSVASVYNYDEQRYTETASWPLMHGELVYIKKGYGTAYGDNYHIDDKIVIVGDWGIETISFASVNIHTGAGGYYAEFNWDDFYPVDFDKAGVGKNDVLTKTNETSYTPTSNYHPATKKYVDDIVGNIETLLGGI